MSGSVDKLAATRILGGEGAGAAMRASQEILAKMAPAGALKLPALLDARRLEYGITDAAFTRQAMFERVFLWQLPLIAGDFVGSESSIILTDAAKIKEKNGAPRGIIISAGLKALDILDSHGGAVGQIVTFIHTAPYHFRYDRIAGHDQLLIVINVGDICGSEDLATEIREGRAHVEQSTPEHGHREHFLRRDGQPNLKPQNVFAGDD